MRRSIVHEGAANLKYEIREIVSVAREIRDLGQSVTWENIGDPIEKGEVIVPWIRDILRELLEQPQSYGYCDTAGVPDTRAFLADVVTRRSGGIPITPEDIIFFNGIGDAVARVYGFLKREARVLGPSPAYSTHSSAEAAHSGYDHVTYELDPHNGWMPNVEDIRKKVEYNDSIAGILLLSPDNPTGAVYPREILDEIVAIAQEHDLFMVADEIYAHITYPGSPRLHMSQWIQDVPALAMRGISKEYPWPGARCGWIEILNRDKDENFNTYVDSLLAAKRLEVCSTTLPQMSIPLVCGDERYPGHLETRAQTFSDRADEAVAAFEGCDAVVVNKPGGAFYLTVMFKENILNSDQVLPIENPGVRTRIEALVADVSADKRFVYYLMGATGIVVVPLTGFQCTHAGFRVTLLESDAVKRAWIFSTLREAIDQYAAS
ncbi:MAG: pyridoxal phosphate-dependent aminotransferase [Candidatus Hydrogenedentes bacterium]|nr:pyridoxal phosphate-dependent aminotransferase [Candidatus Hydrogenedentota bacterium]